MSLRFIPRRRWLFGGAAVLVTALATAFGIPAYEDFEMQRERALVTAPPDEVGKP
jgi:hypothetical protein